MCGIVAYTGNKDISSVLLNGMERLSYRGYDSSGIAVISQGEIHCWKKPGKLKELKNLIQGLSICGYTGIGHTRWATHGIPNFVNAHPHLSHNRVAIVHNGIIENFELLKKELEEKKIFLASETDSELIAHLLEYYWREEVDLIKVAHKVLDKLEGSVAVAALFEGHDREIICMKKNMPLIIGVGEKENFVCSDVQTLMFYSQKYFELDDDEIALVSDLEIKVYDRDLKQVKKKISSIDWKPTEEGKGNFPHFMLKEIYEQPNVVNNILKSYLKNNQIDFFSKTHQNHSLIDLSKIERFIIQACGTSWHAGQVAKYWLENYSRILTEVDVSSELRYRTVLAGKNDAILAISQSGETADTLACIREAKNYLMKVISFVNVRGSSIDRESDLSIYSQAGREVGVASTKNYIAQLLCFYLFALNLGKEKKLIEKDYFNQQIESLQQIPQHLETLLKQSDEIKALAQKYLHHKGFLFIGRGVNYPTALEGALKLKELAYVYAAGYAAGELKHGPLSLVDENMPVFCIIPNSKIYPKILNNLQEVKARKGIIISIASESNQEIQNYSDHLIKIPDVHENLTPILAVVPLQLFAYHLANELGCDVDQPRNLAKSVTVE